MDINIEELKIRKQDLVENPTPRVAICLVLDTSGSMSGEPVAELNEGVKVFFDAIRGDETARYAAEICIVTFGEAGAAKLLDANKGLLSKLEDFFQGQTLLDCSRKSCLQVRTL